MLYFINYSQNSGCDFSTYCEKTICFIENVRKTNKCVYKQSRWSKTII